MATDTLTRIAVKSSHIRDIAWKDKVLEITFKSGGRYRYMGIPQEIWESFQSAESKGKFFYQVIRGHYVEEPVFKKEGVPNDTEY